MRKASLSFSLSSVFERKTRLRRYTVSMVYGQIVPVSSSSAIAQPDKKGTMALER